MSSILYISVQGRVGEVKYGGKKETIGFDRRPLLWSIGRVLKDSSKPKSIMLKQEGMTFSGVRQVVATLNTLAWVLGITINGKKQLKAEYSAEPNITKPSHKNSV